MNTTISTCPRDGCRGSVRSGPCHRGRSRGSRPGSGPAGGGFISRQSRPHSILRQTASSVLVAVSVGPVQLTEASGVQLQLHEIPNPLKQEQAQNLSWELEQDDVVPVTARRELKVHAMVPLGLPPVPQPVRTLPAGQVTWRPGAKHPLSKPDTDFVLSQLHEQLPTMGVEQLQEQVPKANGLLILPL